MDNRLRDGIGMTSRRTRARLVARLRSKGISEEAVLDVIGNIPRHQFVDEAMAHRAYEDDALPIGQGQTISQPFIVALMTQLVMSVPGGVRRVLEIGTGCGYQSAVLANLVETVYSVERIAALQQRAVHTTELLGITNIEFCVGDGYAGWPEAAPFDAIIVTAAPPSPPAALLEQLRDGGRLIVPVGGDGGQQELMQIDRRGDQVAAKTVEYVRFVPLVEGVVEGVVDRVNRNAT